MTAGIENNTTSNASSINSTNPQGEMLIAAFRHQAALMKNWKPASVPSNRDRLELYAWHKQAVSGDAPASLGHTSSATLTAAETAKVNAWRSKRGMDSATAMRQYLQEAERQIRVYGATTSTDPQSLTNGEQPESTSSHPNGNAQNSSQNRSTPNSNSASSRGLAALPLLCAAAAEPRPAYLRRLQTTPAQAAWWRRQEPLVATPGSVTALPEHVLLGVATVMESMSLYVNQWSKTNNSASAAASSTSSTAAVSKTSGTAGGAAASSSSTMNSGSNSSSPSLVAAVVQSALWPLHNALLAVWMGWIVIWAVVVSAYDLVRTILLGSRRTGQSLVRTWQDDVVFAAQSVRALTEAHQPLSARVVGLVLQPLSVMVQCIQAVTSHDPSSHVLSRSCLYVAMVLLSIWYWLVVLPWFLSFVMPGTALLLGNCFALIEWAAHI